MKIKSDFVTNSSSASFILYITSNDNTIRKFKNNWEKYIKWFVCEHRWVLEGRFEKYKKICEDNIKHKNELKDKIDKNEATEKEKWSYEWLYSFRDDKLPTEKEIRDRILGLQNITISTSEDNIYEINYLTSMLNSIVFDMPEWMNILIILDCMKSKKLSEFGFKSVKLVVDDEDYFD